jgi:membrane protease YdiL (CAAX protease family)
LFPKLRFQPDAQMMAPTPPLKLVFLAVVAPLLVNELFKLALPHLPFSPASPWPRVAWLGGTLTSFGIILTILFCRYPLGGSGPDAGPLPVGRRLACMAIVMSLLINYLRPLVRFSSSFPRLVGMAHSPEEQAQLIERILEWPQQIWVPFGFGTDGIGIVLASCAALAAPFVEEPLFRGYLLNALSKAIPLWGAVVASSLVFSATHLSVTTNVRQLTLLFASGMAYGAIRILSGRWQAAALAHLAVNLASMVPKWVIAYLADGLVSR